MPDARVALVAALVAVAVVAVVVASEARWVEAHEVAALVAHVDSNKRLLQIFWGNFLLSPKFCVTLQPK